MTAKNVLHGCQNLFDVKFKDFFMSFQGILKQIQDLLYQLKPKRLTHFFQNKLYLALLNWLILKTKKNQ